MYRVQSIDGTDSGGAREGAQEVGLGWKNTWDNY